ncbi:MAG: hypothetical protein IJV80_04515 [Clostridia bacterium]|nr:hypothetical protein [Clostridia bacterium]
MDGLLKEGFPPADYKENGELKSVRWRVIKKLLKYEYRAVLPIMLVCFGALLILSILVGFRFVATVEELTGDMQEETFGDGLGMMGLLLYVYLTMAVVVLPLILYERRYEKNLFSAEGYLTLATPVSAQEHVLAKHFAAITVELLSIAVAIGCFALMFAVSGGFAILELFGLVFENGSVLSTIEGIFFVLVGTVMIFCASGAITCWLQRFTKKQRSVIISVSVIAIVVLVNVVTPLLETWGIMAFVYESEILSHVWTWVQILFFAFISVLFYLYEVKTLQKNVNLQ